MILLKLDTKSSVSVIEGKLWNLEQEGDFITTMTCNNTVRVSIMYHGVWYWLAGENS